MRKTISIDFDGVIHVDGDEWIAPAVVTGRANPGALQFIHRALEMGFDVVVHSCRFYDLGAVSAVRDWIALQAHEHMGYRPAQIITSRLQYSLTKPRARIYIDDKAWHYTPVRGFPRLEDIT